MQTRTCTRISAAALALAWAGAAQGITIDHDLSAGDWQSAEWSLTGDAFWADDGALTPSQRLRLQDNGNGLNGTAHWNVTTIDPSQDWTVTFTGENSFPQDEGADGMGFHLHHEGIGADLLFDAASSAPDNTDGSGTQASSALSIVLDTHQNSGETLAQALEVFVNGVQLDNFDIAGVDAELFDVEVSYDAATTTLGYSIDNTGFGGSLDASGSSVVDLGSEVGTDAWVALSGTTGGDAENHDVTAFSMTAVPESGTGALLAAGLAVLAVARRRARVPGPGR